MHSVYVSRHLYILLLVGAGCAFNKSSESQSEFAQEVHKTEEQGPTTITTYEFGPPAKEEGSPVEEPSVNGGSTGPVRSQARSTSGSASAGLITYLPEHGPLLKVTVEERGPVTTKTDSDTKAAGSSESASASRFGPGFWTLLLIIGGGIVVLGGAGFVLWKLKPPWMDWAWKLLRLA